MNGGTFTPGVDKVRPGIYTRFFERVNARISGGDRGIVAIPVVLAWGTAQSLVAVSNDSDSVDHFGVGLADPSMLLIREAKKRSSTVLVYRLNQGTRASGAIGEQAKATAVYGGTKGNDIMIRVQRNVLDDQQFDVTTFFDEVEVDRQTVESVEDLVSNAFVTFEGEGSLDTSIGVYLSGGQNGDVTPQAYANFLSALESENFNTVAFPFADEALKATAVSFIRRMREDVGVKVQGVVANYNGSYEGIINVTNGVQLTDGTILSSADATAWVAGATAGASMLQALTTISYEGAVDVSPRFSNTETIKRLKNGEFFFTFDPADKTVHVEQDLNSAAKGKFSKNKIIRTLDAINNDQRAGIKALILAAKASGADIPGNADGLAIIRTGIVQHLMILQEAGAIQNFDPEEDVVISLTASDSVLVQSAAWPVDSIEKVYLETEVI